MTREEEINLCISSLKQKIVLSAQSIEGYIGLTECLYYLCEESIAELQDLMRYINELEELK